MHTLRNVFGNDRRTSHTDGGAAESANEIAETAGIHVLLHVKIKITSRGMDQNPIVRERVEWSKAVIASLFQETRIIGAGTLHCAISLSFPIPLNNTIELTNCYTDISNSPLSEKRDGA